MSGGASRSRWPLVLAAGLALAVVVVGLGRALDTRGLADGALAWITGLGAWGPVAFVLLYVVVTVLLLPAVIWWFNRKGEAVEPPAGPVSKNDAPLSC